MKTWFKTALAILAATVFTTVACNKGDNAPDDSISGPSSYTPSTPVQSTPAPNPATTPGATGIQVDIISSTFDPDRCTDLSDARYSGLTELKHVVKVTNGTAIGAYARPAIFHRATRTCGAHADPPGYQPGPEQFNGANVEPGKSETWTHTFIITDELCGSYQYDNTAKNGEITEFVLGKVINAKRDCPSCDLYNVQLAVTGEGLTRTVKVTFKNLPNNKKAAVNFGDGATAQLGNNESVQHTWPYGTYTVTASLEDRDLPSPCNASATVTNEEPQSCANVNVKFDFASPVEASTVTPSVNKCFQGSWVNPGTGTLDYGDTATTSVNNPFGPSCHGYAQGDTEKEYTAKLTVVRGQLSCPKTLTFKIPPRNQSCDDYTKPVIGGDIASDIQTTQVVFSVGSVVPAGGTFNPTLPQTVARPEYNQPAGSFTTTYVVPYGPEPLHCSVSKPFTKPVPPKDPPQRTCANVNPQVTVDVDGDDAKCTGTWTDPGTGTMALDGNGPQTINNGGFKQYNNLSAGNHTCNLNVVDGQLSCPASKNFTIQPPGQCNMRITKSVNDTTAVPGQELTYRIEIENIGTANCTGGGVQIRDDIPGNVDYKRERHQSNGSFSGNQGGTLTWNFDVMTPGETGWVEWDGKITNPNGNCNDFVIKNRAKVWSQQQGDVTSNEVSTSVDVTCAPSCPPSSTTMSVNWTKLLESTYGNNPKCGDFGLTSLFKKEFGGGVKNWSTDRAASIVIVKDGKCTAEGPDYFAKKASPTDPSKWIGAGLGVSFTCGSQEKDLSHVEMCGCPVGTVSSAQGLFDPYAVPDPTFE